MEVGQIPYASTFGMASHRSTLREVVTDMDVAAPVNASAETWPDYVFASLGNDSQLLSEVFQVGGGLCVRGSGPALIRLIGGAGSRCSGAQRNRHHDNEGAVLCWPGRHWMLTQN